MGRPRTVNCKRCGAPPPPGVVLSARKKCPNCGETAQIQNKRQLEAHNGPYYDHWRERLLAAFGVGIFAEPPAAAAAPAKRLTTSTRARRVAP